MQGRPGSQHIVDDDIAGVRVDSVPVGDDEGPSDVLTPLLPAESRL